MRHSLLVIPFVLTLSISAKADPPRLSNSRVMNLRQPIAQPVAEPAVQAPAQTPQAAQQCNCQQIQAQMKHAFALHDAGQYVEAANEFETIAQRAPAVKAFAARSLAEAGRLPEAYREATLAVQAAGKLPLTHFMLALVLERRGSNAAAMAEYREVLKLDPQNAGAHNNLGGLYYMQEDFNNARIETEDALRLETEADGTAIAMANLAEFDALQGQTKAAEEKLNQALQADPDSAVPYYEFALFYDATGRADAALMMAKNAVQLDKHDAVKRASAFVWPELRVQFEALVAEAKGDSAGAIERWTTLNQMELTTGLHWDALKGVAATHLARLNASTSAESAASLIAPEMMASMSVAPMTVAMR